MSNIAILLVVIVVFVVGVVSPHVAGKIQRKTDSKAGLLKRCANWLWDPLTLWAKNTIEFTRKSIVVVAEWGKKTRAKVAGKPQGNRRKK